MEWEKDWLFDALYVSRDILLLGVDRDGRVAIFNPACEKVSGFGSDEVLGKNFLDFMFSRRHEQSLQGIFEDFGAGKLKGTYELFMPTRSGDERLISWTLCTVTGAEGEPEIALALGRDVTSLRRAQEAIARSEEHFRQLIENALDLVLILRPDGIVDFASPSIRNLLGYEPDEIVGKSVYAIIHPGDVEASHDAIEIATARAGVTKYFELRVRHKDGSWRIHEASSYNLLESPTIKGLVVNSRDITERRETDRALEESRRVLATLLSNLPGMAYRCRNDPDWTIEFASDGCYELTGYHPSDFIDSRTVTYGELIHSDDRERVWNEVQEALAKREPFNLTYRIRTASGVEKWIVEKGRGIYSPQGELLALEGFNTDITDRIRSEMLLRLQRDLAVELGRTSDLDVVLEASMKAILRTTGLDSGGILLMDEESGGLDLVYHEGVSAAFAAEVSHYEADSPGMRLVKEGRPIFRDFADMDLPKTETRRAEGLKVLALVPILCEGKVIGCLNASSHVLHNVPRFARDALETLAGQIGQAIVRARLVSALRDSEQKYRLLHDNVGLAIFSYDRDLKLLSFNNKASEQLGYNEEELIGRNILELGILHPDEFEKAAKGMEKLFAGAVTHTEEHKLIRKDGSIMIMEMTSTPLHDEAGEIAAIIDVMRDITDRRRAEEALRGSENRFRTLLENIYDVITMLDETGTILYESPSIENLLGYGPEELVGKSVFEYIHPEDIPTAVAAFEAGVRIPDYSAYLEVRFLHKDGSWRFFGGVGRNLLANPDVGAIVLNSRDITEHKQAEEALRSNENRFRSLIENTYDMITLLDETGTIIYESPSVETLLGYKPEEMTGKSIFEFIHPEDKLGPETAYEEGVRIEDYSGYIEVRLRHKNGSWRFFGGIGRNRLHDPDVHAIIINSRDITRQRESEEILRKSEERYRATIESSGTAMGLVERDGTISMINRGFEEMFSCAREQVEDKRKYMDFVYHEDLDMARTLSMQLLSGEKESPLQYECRLVDDVGKLMYALVSVSLLPGMERSVASLIDITDRRRAEEAVQKSEERYRATFDTTGTAMFLVERDAAISDANREMEKIFGYSHDEVVGKMRYMDLIMPEDVEKVKGFSRELLSGEIEGPIQYEIKARHKTGRPIDALISVNVMPGIGKSVVSLIDITEKKAYERMLEESTEQLRDFLDIAAHELRHPATLLKGYAITLSRHGEKIGDEAWRDSLLGIEAGSDRLVYVVEELLDVSRLQRGRFTVNIGIASARQLAEGAVEEMLVRETGREIALHLADDVDRAWADPERLTRLFIILLDNAVKYSPPGSLIELQGEKKDNELVFSVLDRGVGIPEAERKNIFERFFQVRDVLHHTGPGLGLGLYIAKRIVDAHGGSLLYEPREGGGSIFRFSIPSA